MPQGLENIRSTLAKISQGDDLLSMLCEFERTLDHTGLFGYANWLDGELIQGPEVSKYWFKTTWMFHKTNMPDPRGGMRLKKLGCRVSFTEDCLEQPRKILEPTDWDNKRTKKAKMDEIPVWLVEIDMPLKYITEGNDEIHQLLNDELDNDTEAVAQDFEADEETDTADADAGAEGETEEDKLA